MNIKTKKYLILLFLIFSFLLPVFAFATSYDYTPMENIPGFSKSGDFVAYILSIYKFGIWAIGIAALLMIMIGGFMYITSAGNNASMEKARGIITDAIIGILMALTAWLLLYIINPELVKMKTISLSGTGTGGTGSSATGTLATGCNNYASTFSSVSGGDKNLECLLIGIANQESGCNPNLTSSQGACGMMQFLPSTAGISCDDLKSNPDKSIRLAKQYLDTARSKIQSYSRFSIGSSNSLSGQSVTYGSYTYDTGNDDLIASYNAGFGTTSGGNKKGPFEISSDCPSPVTPAWQCNINSSGFAETQNYVIKVQNYQKQCLSK